MESKQITEDKSKKKKNLNKKPSNCSTSLSSDDKILAGGRKLSDSDGNSIKKKKAKKKNSNVESNTNIIKNQITYGSNNLYCYPSINAIAYQQIPMQMNMNQQMIAYPYYGYLPYNSLNGLNIQLNNLLINSNNINQNQINQNQKINSKNISTLNNNNNLEIQSHGSSSKDNFENEDDSLELVVVEDLQDILAFKDEVKFINLHYNMKTFIKTEDDVEKLILIYNELSLEDTKYFEALTNPKLLKDSTECGLISHYLFTSISKLYEKERKKEEENLKDGTFIKKLILLFSKNFKMLLKSKDFCKFIADVINSIKLDQIQVLFPYILQNFQSLIKSKNKSCILKSIIDVTAKNEYTNFSQINSNKNTENIDYLEILDKVSLKENIEEFRKNLLTKFTNDLFNSSRRRTGSSIIIFLINSWSSFYCNKLVVELMKNVEDLIYNECSYSILEFLFQNFENNADLTNNIKKMLYSIRDYSKVYNDEFSYKKFKYLITFLNYYDLKAYSTHLYKLNKEIEDDSFIKNVMNLIFEEQKN